MVALADVRRWDAAGLEEALRGLGRVRDRVVDLDGELATAIPGDAVWQGVAAGRARSAHEGLAERLRRVAAGMSAARVALADAADAVAAIPAELRRADDLAARHGFTIGPDGAVTDPNPPVVPVEQVETVRAERSASQSEIVDILTGVLRRADQVDTVLRAALERAVAEQVDDGTGRTLAGAAAGATGAHPGGPPAGANPAQVAAWWAGLGNAEQEQLLVSRPELVGNLDGVPAAVRDEANRARLPDLAGPVDDRLADAERRWYGSLGVAPGGAPVPSDDPTENETAEQRGLREQVERLRDQRGAVAAVAAAADAPGRQLLALDIDGHIAPRAAIAVGDVDTARHVGVFTPGLTTTVSGSLGGYVRDMEELQQNSEKQLVNRGRIDEGVATVAWLGYDAPQWDTMTEADRSVLLARSAEHGGADLARFYDGINATHQGDPHLTAIGHSYGSTTTGYGLQNVTTPVDDAVVFGSPGLGTGDVSDLRVPDGHVGVIEAHKDPVADFGRFGTDPNQISEVAPLASHAATAPDGTPLRGSEGHSEYLVPGTTSQHNIGATVAGLPEDRVVGTDKDIGDYLRHGPAGVATR